MAAVRQAHVASPAVLSRAPSPIRYCSLALSHPPESPRAGCACLNAILTNPHLPQPSPTGRPVGWRAVGDNCDVHGNRNVFANGLCCSISSSSARSSLAAARRPTGGHSSPPQHASSSQSMTAPTPPPSTSSRARAVPAMRAPSPSGEHSRPGGRCQYRQRQHPQHQRPQRRRRRRLQQQRPAHSQPAHWIGTKYTPLPI